MKEPAFKHPIIPGVVIKVVPLNKPTKRFKIPETDFNLSTSVVAEL
jgi:hypothetical protein